LVAGGSNRTGSLRGAEIFDPVTGKFDIVGSLRQPRSGAQSVLLPDGRVLVVGGATGRRGSLVPTASAELFDPITGRFTDAGSMAEARYKHAAVRLNDGRVLVIAGSDDNDREGKKQTLEIFDPVRGTFTSGGTLRHARYKLGDAVVLLRNGKVLIAGGARHPEIYDPVSRETEVVALDLGEIWNFMSAARLPDGRVLLAGGYSEGDVEVSNRTWLLNI